MGALPTYTQFLHIDLYGRAPRRGAAAWACIDGITREGARVPGATLHIRYPKTPRVLVGMSPIEAGDLAKVRGAAALDAIGRRLRRDGAMLMAVVASYPIPKTLVQDRDQPHEADLYGLWCAETIGWLKEQFGAALISVVEHRDEEYLHLHAYAVPAIGPDQRLCWAAIHPGRDALARSTTNKCCKKDTRAAYIESMRQMQDNFHDRVSRYFDHHRHGPRRKRLSRQEYLLEIKARIKECEQERDFKIKLSHSRKELSRTLRLEFEEPLKKIHHVNKLLETDNKRALARIADQKRRIEHLEDEIMALREEILQAQRLFGGHSP